MGLAVDTPSNDSSRGKALVVYGVVYTRNERQAVRQCRPGEHGIVLCNKV